MNCQHPFTAIFILLLRLAPATGDEANSSLKWHELSPGLEAWNAPKGWIVAEQVQLDPASPKRLVATAGTVPKMLVTDPKGAHDLSSKEQFGDHEVRLEFLIPKGSNSGVKFHGLYEIQIFDSFGKKEPTASDCGGIYPRAELLPIYRHIDEGIPPRVNAARPAGEWQTFEAIFKAPRFDAAGKKTASARLMKAVLNGKVIHEDVELKTPTGHAWRNAESATGPLLLQGDHGPIAFRNVRVRQFIAKP